MIQEAALGCSRTANCITAGYNPSFPADLKGSGPAPWRKLKERENTRRESWEKGVEKETGLQVEEKTKTL